MEKLFQASKIGTARLQEFSVLDESRQNAEDVTQKVLKPLHSIISEKALACSKFHKKKTYYRTTYKKFSFQRVLFLNLFVLLCLYFCFFSLTVLSADKVIKLPQEPTVVQADATLQRILLGQPYFLEQYRSLASKTSLLDAAIKSGDGNAILIVSSSLAD